MAETFIPVLTSAPAAVPALDGPAEHGWLGQKLIRPFSRKSAIRKLARIFDIAKDHEANGVPAGHGLYKTLFRQATQVANDYAAEWDIAQDVLFAQIPSLPQLRKLADPAVEAGGGKAGLAVAGLFAVVAVPLVVGAWSGLFSVGYQWVRHLFGG